MNDQQGAHLNWPIAIKFLRAVKQWQVIFFEHVLDTDSGKHGMMESSAERYAELFSKTSEMVPNSLNIPQYEFEDL